MIKFNICLGVILMVPVLISCNKNSENSSVDEKESAGNGILNCYLYVENSDTIKMEITAEGKRVTGNLIYNLNQKDKNTGTIKGEMQGNKLAAVYTFMSEGVESSRQVIFKKNGDTFTEGYYVDGNYTITDFPGTVVLQKIKCE